MLGRQIVGGRGGPYFTEALKEALESGATAARDWSAGEAPKRRGQAYESRVIQ
jgi:hypothetical protein